MTLSIFDLFKIGVGPSSSHTVGPMVAANRFLEELAERRHLPTVCGIRAHLYGSLAMTGLGHATDTAVIVGLLGETPEDVDARQIPDYLAEIERSGTLPLAGCHPVPFRASEHLRFHHGDNLPKHPNGLRLEALDEAGLILYSNVYYSVGGGFVLSCAEADASGRGVATAPVAVTYPFHDARSLLQQADDHGLTIADLVLANEAAFRSEEATREGLARLWQTMDECIRLGCKATGNLPGGLNIPRRANQLYRELRRQPERGLSDQLTVMDWINLYAMAVNEQNAAGARVVTAPTNGAAGVIPAVLAYYDRFVPGSNAEGINTFLATAAAIGMLYKHNASISAAEVGCQGEIGVACSMAAAALCAVLGGDNQQIENAAEIGMEHNLGLTCDPIAGLVQVPCIERNTMGAVKAINAARLALRGTGEHHVSLDAVIRTMHQTGLDMQAKYKETATGGLAVNTVAC
ncbi:L-serine ammonia-lyase [Parahaliea maris]|uniref:L-serine dehydratase n=1 Tax=Parahaliea maris TaxID=2716870 RepID=A0A5C8ZU79_9GAMM|nr:L-serine ammonia-lyase [Parahaliea maris]TXS92048.1 L-serine ammonia-lyase [Parahaliea maris]